MISHLIIKFVLFYLFTFEISKQKKVCSQGLIKPDLSNCLILINVENQNFFEYNLQKKIIINSMTRNDKK